MLFFSFRFLQSLDFYFSEKHLLYLHQGNVMLLFP